MLRKPTVKTPKDINPKKKMYYLQPSQNLAISQNTRQFRFLILLLKNNHHLLQSKLASILTSSSINISL